MGGILIHSSLVRNYSAWGWWRKLQHHPRGGCLTLEYSNCCDGDPARVVDTFDQGRAMAAGNRVLQSIVAIVITCGVHDAWAADINGVWVSDASVCLQVFERKGGKVLFAKDADIHGSGFIIEGNQIRGRFATCVIKLRKEQGAMVNLIAVCSTDIAIDTAQFSLRMDGPDKITREFAGIPELVMHYERCSL
jgi:hypothetical protein